jgi:hypothetical protein
MEAASLDEGVEDGSTLASNLAPVARRLPSRSRMILMAISHRCFIVCPR